MGYSLPISDHHDSFRDLLCFAYCHHYYLPRLYIPPSIRLSFLFSPTSLYGFTTLCTYDLGFLACSSSFFSFTLSFADYSLWIVVVSTGTEGCGVDAFFLLHTHSTRLLHIFSLGVDSSRSDSWLWSHLQTESPMPNDRILFREYLRLFPTRGRQLKVCY